MNISDAKIAIIGLGYVGLPLAVEFGKKYKTVGFDINEMRVSELVNGIDSTLECSSDELKEAIQLSYSADKDSLKNCNTYIVTVPTPIDSHKQPDLTPLVKASEMLGSVINKGDVIIYESTVYPGATEEECIPILEKISGLKFNIDFFAGYSPERINPGDKEHRLNNILKVTSGSTSEIAEFVDELYKTIIIAGTHKASSIRVAEAAKVIENIQRDVNIALVNELHQIFTTLDLSTIDVIEAASTKWNFMKLMPGLVGGHCIGVDPYYLLHKSQAKGYIPDLIRTAREINDSMPSFIANDFLRYLLKKKVNPVGARVLLCGFTFKENCPDLRNTKNYQLYLELIKMGFDVLIYDPWVNAKEAEKEYGISVLSSIPAEADYDVIVITVGHSNLISEVKSTNSEYVYDFKGLLN